MEDIDISMGRELRNGKFAPLVNTLRLLASNSASRRNDGWRIAKSIAAPVQGQHIPNCSYGFLRKDLPNQRTCAAGAHDDIDMLTATRSGPRLLVWPIARKFASE